MTLFVIDDVGKVVGTLTDGDVRRAFLREATIEDPVTKVMHTNFSYLERNKFTIQEVIEFRENLISMIPVLNKNHELVGIVDFTWMRSMVPVDTVIMAGGKGMRLRPLTDKLPKPLLEVGDKPILEHTIDRLRKFGIENIHLSVNYMGEKIEAYFGDGTHKGLNIKYIHEQKPLGTIGALSKIEQLKNEYLLVMNSDLLTTVDFEDFFLTFILSGADMSVATTSYEVKVPYAILETKNGEVTSFTEKPTFSHFSNAGIYLLKKKALEIIPHNKFYNATDLMQELIYQGRKVSYYPILGYWLDIGRHEDYKKAQEDIKHLSLK